MSAYLLAIWLVIYVLVEWLLKWALIIFGFALLGGLIVAYLTLHNRRIRRERDPWNPNA